MSLDKDKKNGVAPFNEARCPSCGRMVNWNGRILDRPPCQCGYQLPQKKLEEIQARFDALVAKAAEGKLPPKRAAAPKGKKKARKGKKAKKVKRSARRSK